ncbi:MFS transporter [Actinomadura sp. GTD37]|uniref:MFS transporter n=1 Tax=Actinomadura sp. GTD37 TaxID=1778030 RepID=UPI0035C0AAB7
MTSAPKEQRTKPSPPDATFVWTSRHVIVLTVLCLGHILETIDMTVVNVALPRIKSDLAFSEGDLSWVVNAYTVTFGGFLLLCGRAGDLLGRRRVFIGGLVLFTVASLLAGLAGNAGTLVGARALQGLAAAFIGPMTLAMLTSTFPEGPPRNKAIGLWGMLSGVSAAVGLLVGGVFVDGPGWEWIFWLNIPLGVVLVLATLRYLDADRPARRFHRFDLPGAVTVTGGIGLLAYAIVQTHDHGWGSGRTIGLFAAALVLIGYFTVHEARVAKEPLMDLSLLKIRSVSSANVVQALTNSGMFVMFYLATLYQQNVLHYSPIKTGLAYVPMTLLLVAFARVGPMLMPKFGVRNIVFAGAMISAIGLLLFSRVSPDGSFLVDVLVPSLFLGVGVALTFIPTTVAAVSGVPKTQAGLVSGLVNVSRTVGGALGLAVVSTLAANHSAGLLKSGAVKADALTEGFQLGFLISAGLLAFAGITALALFPKPGASAGPGAARH